MNRISSTENLGGGWWFADDVRTCAGLDIPDGVHKYGVWDNDLLVFVSSSPDSLEKESWGAPCVYDKLGGNNRILVGRVWINSNWLEAHDDDDNVANFLQQMTHVLGVHYKAYDLWVDPWDSHKYATVVERFDNHRGKCVYKLTTPNVRAKSA